MSTRRARPVLKREVTLEQFTGVPTYSWAPSSVHEVLEGTLLAVCDSADDDTDMIWVLRSDRSAVVTVLSLSRESRKRLETQLGQRVRLSCRARPWEIEYAIPRPEDSVIVH